MARQMTRYKRKAWRRQSAIRGPATGVRSLWPSHHRRSEDEEDQGRTESVHLLRCVYYNKGDHPRIRLPEAELDRQVLEVFASMRIEDDDVRDWFRMVLASQTKDSQDESKAQRSELTRQETLCRTSLIKLRRRASSSNGTHS